MYQSADILNTGQNHPLVFNELDVLQDIERTVPGSVHYAIKRYQKVSSWSMEDAGMLITITKRTTQRIITLN